MKQMIKTYRSGFPHVTSVGRRFREDAARLAREGWVVQSMSEARSAWVINGHTIHVVYVRNEKTAQDNIRVERGRE